MASTDSISVSFVITDEDTYSDQEETEKTAQVKEYSQWILSEDTLCYVHFNAFTKMPVICVGEWLDVVRKYSW